MTLHIKTTQGIYPIDIQRGLLQCASEWFHLDRKVLIITDDGVPEQYAMTVASQCREAIVFVFEQGEASKNMDTYMGILQALTDNGFTRTDCVVAVGGGVVGDMAGFAAATYMRGVDYYNIPTTVLAQVDASVGGKTAIDFMGYKNLVGAFYPPKGVLIDPDVLSTLPARQVSNGLAEAVKMALTHDAELFALLEEEELTEKLLEEVIIRAVRIKQQVVEADEKECGLRRVLNFGHTLGHGIESATQLYHGECVALGMLPMCSDAVRERLVSVLLRLGLPTEANYDLDTVLDACRHDKKMDGDRVSLVTVSQIGTFEITNVLFEEFQNRVKEVAGE